MDGLQNLFDGMSFVPKYEMRAAFFGSMLIIAAFAVAVGLSFLCRMNGLRKKLFKATVKLSNLDRVDEENVDEVYQELQKLPEPTAKGWGRYLEDRKGYPSDYIAARDVLGKREYNGKNTVGKVFYVIASVIIGIICAMGVAAMYERDGASATESYSLVASVICGIIIPTMVFAVLYFALEYLYGRHRIRLELSFASFQEILDAKVLIEEQADEDYSDAELEAIAQEVDSILGEHLDDDEETQMFPRNPVEELPEEEIEEPVLPPEFEELEEELESDEEMIVEEPEEDTAPIDEEIVMDEEVEPESEAAAEEAPEPFIPMTKEEAERYLSVLLVVVDSAMADPETTDEDLEEIAVLIETARLEAFREPEDQEILEECLIKLAQRWHE